MVFVCCRMEEFQPFKLGAGARAVRAPRHDHGPLFDPLRWRSRPLVQGRDKCYRPVRRRWQMKWVQRHLHCLYFEFVQTHLAGPGQHLEKSCTTCCTTRFLRLGRFPGQISAIPAVQPLRLRYLRGSSRRSSLYSLVSR